MDMSSQLSNFSTELISHQKGYPCDDNLFIHGPGNSATTFWTTGYKYRNVNAYKELINSITFHLKTEKFSKILLTYVRPVLKVQYF